MNSRGRAQAEAAAAALRDVPLAVIQASPQPRAQETAASITAHHGLQICTDPALDEVWVGRWQGKTWQELQDDADVQRVLRDPTFLCDEIEPIAQVQARVVASVERLRESAAAEALALVSHGDPIRVLLAHYLSMDLSCYRRLIVDTGSICVLRFGARNPPRLLLLNWRPHAGLPALLSESSRR